MRALLPPLLVASCLLLACSGPPPAAQNAAANSPTSRPGGASTGGGASGTGSGDRGAADNSPWNKESSSGDAASPSPQKDSTTEPSKLPDGAGTPRPTATGTATATASPTATAAPVPAGGLKNGCNVTQVACPKAPAQVGTFLDTFEAEATTNSMRCLARGREWAAFCYSAPGTPPTTSPVIARFVANGVVLAERQSLATNCVIDQPSCPSQPSVKTHFIDDVEGASTLQARCLRRAQEFADLCQNPPGVKTSATFLSPTGEIVAVGLGERK